MTLDELVALRKRLGLTQAQMAERIGLGLRAYTDIENGRSELRRIHMAAAEGVSLAVAAEKGDPMLALPSVRRHAHLITAGPHADLAEFECSAGMRSIAAHLRILADMEPNDGTSTELRGIAGQLDRLARQPFGPGAVDEFESLQEGWREAGVAVWDDVVGEVIRLQLAEEMRKR